MNAIQGTDADIRQLATTSGYSFDSIKDALAVVSTGLANVGSQVGMSALQVVNAIQSGNAALASQFAQCCCENKLLVTSQGYENQLRTVEQTNAITGAISDLKAEMISQFCASEKRDMLNEISTKNEIISTLKGQIDNANQTAQIAALIAPVKSEVEAIKASQPNTVAVQWPNLVAVNSTPFSGFNGYGYGFNGSSYWG
jgi:predicted O-linked N-acetylglucosamine transferase (SPINDLY family)